MKQTVFFCAGFAVIDVFCIMDLTLKPLSVDKLYDPDVATLYPLMDFATCEMKKIDYSSGLTFSLISFINS